MISQGQGSFRKREKEIKRLRERQRERDRERELAKKSEIMAEKGPERQKARRRGIEPEIGRASCRERG